MFSKLDEMKGILLQKNHGIDFRACSAEEWLDLAIETEQMAKLCGPFDQAYPHLIEKQIAYEKASELAQKIETEPSSLAP